jgi:hypothetical protein
VKGAQRAELEEEAARAFAFVALDVETRDVQIVPATWLAAT